MISQIYKNQCGAVGILLVDKTINKSKFLTFNFVFFYIVLNEDILMEPYFFNVVEFLVNFI